MFAAEIPSEIIGGIVGLLTVTFIGLSSWALHMLVKLSSVVSALEARLEERSEDHERRLRALEEGRVI